MADFRIYQQIFLDFDGVIVDSNRFKSTNILNAAKLHLSDAQANTFSSYFIGLNGVPRELKTYQYFDNKSLADNILKDYEKLNQNLIQVPLTPGVLPFLKSISNHALFILSGGDLKEIQLILQHHQIAHFFKGIMSGPLTKEQNLKNISITPPALFIGDALHDAEVAKQFGLDFIFMHQFTQAINWDKYSFPKDTKFIFNLKELI